MKYFIIYIYMQNVHASLHTILFIVSLYTILFKFLKSFYNISLAVGMDTIVLEDNLLKDR